MNLDYIKKIIDETKAQKGNIDNYEFHLHSQMANKIREEIEELSTSQIGIRTGKLLGFPVIINDAVPPDKIYFVDWKALKKIRGAL